MSQCSCNTRNCAESFSGKCYFLNLTHFSRCGFYGNPIYHGYCSKCYKELVRDAPKAPDTLQKVPEEQVDSGMQNQHVSIHRYLWYMYMCTCSTGLKVGRPLVYHTRISL